eukprot:tig00000983_g5915.t1
MAAPPPVYGAITFVSFPQNSRPEEDDGEAEYEGADNLQGGANAGQPAPFQYATRPAEHLEDNGDDDDFSDEPPKRTRRKKKGSDSDDEFKPSDEEDDDDIVESDPEDHPKKGRGPRRAPPHHIQRGPAPPRPVAPVSRPYIPPPAHAFVPARPLVPGQPLPGAFPVVPAGQPLPGAQPVPGAYSAVPGAQPVSAAMPPAPGSLPPAPGTYPSAPPAPRCVPPGPRRVSPGTRNPVKQEFELSVWEDGVRRSSRSRKQLTSQPLRDGDEDFSEEEGEGRGGKRAGAQRAPARAPRAPKDEEESEPEWDDGDDDEEEEGGSRKKRGGRPGSFRGSTPVFRVATRSGPRKKYEEQEEDERMEDETAGGDEAATDPAAGYPDAEQPAEEEGPVVDKVVRHRDIAAQPPQAPDPAQTARSSPATVREYWIKWKGRSYIYNTWHQENELVAVKGYKKLQNYIQKQDQIELFKRTHGQDEVEEQAIENELDTELQCQHANIERVIKGEQCEDGTMTYLIKWEGLPYSECTWEPEPELLRELELRLDDAWFAAYEAAIRDMLAREERSRQPSHDPFKTLGIRHGANWQKMATQPEFLKGGELRDYQLEGLNWMAYSWNNNKNVILADEMGLGKTLQTISYVSYIFYVWHCRGPFIVVVPLSTLAAWMKEFKKWVPDMNVVVYIGDQKSREMIREHEFPHGSDRRRVKFDVLLTTYEIVNKDCDFLRDIGWALLVVDEAHRLKSDKSALYQTLASFNAANKLLVTGTPIQNEMKELWCLLHFLNPDQYRVSAEFEQRYADVRTNPETVKRLHAELQSSILRRLKSDVEKSLPPKMERILRVDMARQQREFYTMILNKNWKELFKGARNQHGCLINIIVELKKCCNHPYLVAPPEQVSSDYANDWVGALIRSSGKMILLDKLLKRLKETGHRVLIFSQMVKMLNILSDYLTARGYKFQRLDGTMRGDMRQQCMEHFNAPGSDDFCFLLSTRAGGLGINLATADTVIIYDSDWNPQNDLQAEARAHRIGQKNVVNIYRFVTSTSVEEDILERAKRKLVLDHVVIQQMDTSGRTVLGKKPDKIFNRDELAQALRFGAEKLFDKEAANDATEDLDLDAILARADQTAGADARPDQRSVDGLLSAFKVANFNIHGAQEEEKPKEDDAAFWSRFISEEDRKRYEADPAAAAADNVEFDEKGRPIRRARADASAAPPEVPPPERSRGGKERAPPRRRGRSGAGVGEKERKMFKRWLLKLGTRRAREIREKCASLAHLTDLEIHEMEKEFTAMCHESIAAFKEAKAQGRPLPGLPGDKDGSTLKRPMFVYGEEKVDAEEALKTIKRLEELHRVVLEWRQRDGGNIQKFRAPVIEPSRWQDWGQREDNAVLLGCYRHGIGSWQLIREDASLSLSHVLPTDMKQGAGPGADGEKGGGLTGNKLMTRVNRMLDTLIKMRQTQEQHAPGASSAGAGGAAAARKRARPPPRGAGDGEGHARAKAGAGGAKAPPGTRPTRKEGASPRARPAAAPRRRQQQRRRRRRRRRRGRSRGSAGASGAGGAEEDEETALVSRARRWLADTAKEAMKKLREVLDSGDKSKEASQKLAKYLRTIGKAVDELLAEARRERLNAARLETLAWGYVADRYASKRMDGTRLRDTYVKIRQNAAAQAAAGPAQPGAAPAAGASPVPPPGPKAATIGRCPWWGRGPALPRGRPPLAPRLWGAWRALPRGAPRGPGPAPAPAPGAAPPGIKSEAGAVPVVTTHAAPGAIPTVPARPAPQ